MQKAQSPLEYLLGIGGVVLVSVIVLVLVVSVSQTGTENLEGSGESVFELLLESGESSILRIDPGDDSPLSPGTEGAAAFFDATGSEILSGATISGADGDGDSALDQKTIIIEFEEPSEITSIILNSNPITVCGNISECELICETTDNKRFTCKIPNVPLGEHELEVNITKISSPSSEAKNLKFNVIMSSDPCELIPETEGFCKKLWRLPYYNQQTGTCQVLETGGCYIIIKPFETMDECQTTCEGTTIGEPVLPILTATPGDGEVSLSWTAATGYDFTGYRVYGAPRAGEQATTHEGECGFIETSDDLSCEITGLVNDTTYFFIVTVENDLDSTTRELERSNQVSAIPKVGRCQTDAVFTPSDTDCTAAWPDVPVDSFCSMVEVCSADLDYIVEDAIECANGGSPPSSVACTFAENNATGDDTTIIRHGLTTKGFNTAALYIIKGFGSTEEYMQGYFEGETCCSGDCLTESKWGTCDPYPENLTPENIDPGITGTLFCDPDPDAVVWESDTDMSLNNCKASAPPTHASINILSTGICGDYARATITIIRKLGFMEDEALTTSLTRAASHRFNLIKLKGDPKFHVFDTTGRRASNIVIGGVPAGRDVCTSRNYCCIGSCNNDNGTTACPDIENIHGCSAEEFDSKCCACPFGFEVGDACEAKQYPSVCCETNANIPGTCCYSSGNTIDACREITEEGTYTLAEDITEMRGANCIEITADNVTLNGNGNTITGSGTWTGILIEERQNVNVNNVTVTGFATGIKISEGSENTISNSTFTNNAFGIYLDSSLSNIISNSTFTNNDTGINLYSSSSNIISNSTSTNNDTGIYLYSSSSNNTISDSSFSDNSVIGIQILEGSENTIENTIASGNTNGVIFNLSPSNTISGSLFCGNDDLDLVCISSSGNSGTGNRLDTVMPCEDWPLEGDYDSCSEE